MGALCVLDGVTAKVSVPSSRSYVSPSTPVTYGSRDAEETGFSGALMDGDGEAFDNGISPAKGLSGTKLSGDLEYLRALPDLRMPRLPGIRAVVEIDGAEVSFKPGEEAMRQATSGSVGRGVLGGGGGGGGSNRSSTAASAQTDSD
jgi:hypothetical protein